MTPYRNFILRKESNGIMISGYHWEIKNPIGVLCLIHGIGEHAGRYRRMAEQLGRKKIAVMAMDLRGHGISSGVRGDASPRKDILDDITELIGIIEKTYPGKPIVLYGHSMGGNIALDYRGRGEKNGVLKGFVISAPWITLAKEPSFLKLKLVNVLCKAFPKKQVSSTIDEKLLGNLEQVRPYHSDPLVHNFISLRCGMESFALGKSLFQRNKTRRVTVPTYLLHGTKDEICRIQGSRDFVEKENDPKIKFEELEGYYHEIHNGKEDEDGEKVIEKIGSFIEDILA